MGRIKSEALRIIHSGAVAYRSNLVNNNVLFVSLNGNKAEYFETTFLPRNFLHLTGVRTSLNSTTFFSLALRDRLREQDITFADDGTTVKKLDILYPLMNICKTAKMLGDYDHSQRLLVTDKLAGTISIAMGFRKDGLFYVPNTSLKTDMRTISAKPIHRIAAVLCKKLKQTKYCTLTYMANGITIDDEFFVELHEKIDYANLVADFAIPRKNNGIMETLDNNVSEQFIL